MLNIDTVGFLMPNMKPVLSVFIVWSVVQDEGIYKPEDTEPAQSLANDVCSRGSEEEEEEDWREEGQCPH